MSYDDLGDWSLYIPSRRVKIMGALVLLLAVYQMSQELQRIRSDVQGINHALRAEFDATKTPPSERTQPTFGAYHVPIDDEDGEGDG